jgi:hypothetical protein
VTAAAAATSAERQSWPARDRSRAERGRGQQYTEVSHRFSTQNAIFGSRLDANERSCFHAVNKFKDHRGRNSGLATIVP